MSTYITEIVCEFCGKKRNIKHYIHGDNDEGGRCYGIYETDNDKGCTCELGIAKFNNSKINPCCVNCEYYMDNRCENIEMKSEVSSRFEVNDLKVKDNTLSCSHWKLNLNLFNIFSPDKTEN